MATIITNMSWKAPPDYNAKNSTAKEPDENGIVQFEEGTVARTDNVDIVFTDKLGSGNTDPASQVQSDAAALKGSNRLAEAAANFTPLEGEIWMAGFDRTIYRTDGSSFTAHYLYNYRESKGYDSNYLSAIAAEVKGENDKGFHCLTNNLESDIVSAFSSAASMWDDKYAIRDSIEALMAEIKQNIADGKADPTKDLQTKVTVNGVEWNLAELIDTVEVMKKGFDELDHTITLNYEEYAKMGISSVFVNDWASKNLSEEQAAAVAKAVDERIYGYVKRQDEQLERDADTWKDRYVPPEKAEYYAYGSWVSASNVEHREAIQELFSSVDYNSPSNLASAMNKYRSLMTPVLLAYGATQRYLPDYLGDTVNHLYSYISKLFGTQGAARSLDTSV